MTLPVVMLAVGLLLVLIAAGLSLRNVKFGDGAFLGLVLIVIALVKWE